MRSPDTLVTARMRLILQAECYNPACLVFSWGIYLVRV